MRNLRRWTIYDRGPNTGMDWALRPGVEPIGMDPKAVGIEVVEVVPATTRGAVSDLEHKREVDRLNHELAQAQREAAQMRRTAVRHAQDAASAHQQQGAVSADIAQAMADHENEHRYELTSGSQSTGVEPYEAGAEDFEEIAAFVAQRLRGAVSAETTREWVINLLGRTPEAMTIVGHIERLMMDRDGWKATAEAYGVAVEKAEARVEQLEAALAEVVRRAEGANARAQWVAEPARDALEAEPSPDRGAVLADPPALDEGPLAGLERAQRAEARVDQLEADAGALWDLVAEADATGKMSPEWTGRAREAGGYA